MNQKTLIYPEARTVVSAGSVAWMQAMRRMLLFATAAVLLAAAVFTARSGVYSGWTHSARVHINTHFSGANISSPQYDFPLLVRVDSTNIDFSQARSDGGDIRFAKANETTALSYELEQWDAANKKAAIWVKLDTVKAMDSLQFFMMYWGNAGATSASDGKTVFDTANGFVGVWHLHDDLLDATAWNRTGTNYGSADSGAVVGDGQVFNGVDSISLGTFTSSDSGMVEAWICLHTSSLTQAVVGGVSSFEMGVSSANQMSNALRRGVGLTGSTSLSMYQWYHLAATYDAGAMSWTEYLNGGYETSGSGTPVDPGAFSLKIGSAASGNFFYGLIDEVRVHRKQRSADWVKLSYETQKLNCWAVKVLRYWGPVWYVDSAAASGGDGSLAAPFDSLQKALGAASSIPGSPHDTIKVAKGSYTTTSGFMLKDSLVMLGGYSSGFAARNPESNVTILQDDAYDSDVLFWPAIGGAGGYCEIDGFHIRNGDDGISATGPAPSTITVRNCRIYGGNYCGINISTSSKFIIKNNVFYNNPYADIQIQDGKHRIENNTFDGAYSTVCIGLFSAQACSTVIMNNIIVGASYGIQQNVMVDPDSVLYNVFTGNTTAPYYYYDQSYSLTQLAAKGRCYPNYSFSPMFVDSSYSVRNYHLRPYSRCIDAGNPLSAYSLEPSNNGGRINLGAYGNTPYATVNAYKGPVWYVDSTNGSPSGTGSLAQPFDSLQTAFDAVRPGDTVKVAKGSFYRYYGYTLPDSIVLLGGYNPGFTVRVPDSLFSVISSNYYYPVLSLPDDSLATGFCVIDGFVVTGGQHGIYAYMNRQTSIRIRNNYIINNGMNPACGIHIETSTANILIQNNILAQNMGAQIYLDSARARIINNTIVASYSDNGIQFLTARACSSVVMNNIFYGGEYAIYQTAAVAPDSILYNSFWGQIMAAYRKDTAGVSLALLNAFGACSHNDSIAPRFVDEYAGDYHQTSASKCIDAGNPLSVYSQEPANNGGRINLGAFGNTPRATPNRYSGPVWYVKAGAAAGGNGSLAAPFDSIHVATACAYKGDTVKIAAGTYLLDTTANFSDMGVVVLGGYTTDFSQRDAEKNRTVLDGQNSYSVFQAFYISNNSNDSVTIDGLVFQNMRNQAVYVSEATGTRITNNRFFKCGKGIYEYWGNGLYVANNVFARDTIGVSTYESDNAHIINNTFAKNVQYGFYFYYSYSAEVVNNIFAHNGFYGIYEDQMMGSISPCKYNSFYNNLLGVYSLSGTGKTIAEINATGSNNNNAILEPFFKDTSSATPNYHLRYGSPCIDAGDPTYPYANEPYEPYTGGARINLGAYGNTQWATTKSDMSPPAVPSTTITWPNGGEFLKGGSACTITWNAAGIVDDDLLKQLPISLRYSLNGGTTYDSLILTSFPNSGSASWTVPMVNTSTALVRIGATDSLGNTAYDVSNAVFTIDSRAPSGSLTITDVNGATADADPLLLVTSSDADSMRFAASAAFKRYAGNDSVNISSGGQGVKIVSVQLKDRAGNVSGWFSDTTYYDLSAPTAALTTTGQYDRTNWPGTVTGTAADNKAGVKSVKIAVRNQSSGAFWNGSAWTTDTAWVTASGGTSWSYALAATSMSHGRHRVHMIATDSVGNTALKPDTASYMYVSDAPTPAFSATPRSGVTPLSVTFTDSSVGVVTSVVWNFGDSTAVQAGQPRASATHTYAKPGKYHITLTATGPGGSNTVTRSGYIDVLNTPPVLAPVPDDTVYEDSPWSDTLSATDHDNDRFIFTLLRQPVAMTIDTATGIMNWTPRNEDVGVHQVVAKCIDVNSGVATDTFTITVLDVNDPPETYITGKQVSYGAVKFAVKAVDDYDSIITFEMKLVRSADAAVIVDTMRTKKRVDTLIVYPLADGTYTLAVAGIDTKNLKDTTAARDSVTVSGANTHTYGDTSYWHIVSVPATAFAVDSLAKGGKLSYWDEGSPKKSIYDYYVPSSDVRNVVAGRAYWRKSSTPVAIRLDSAALNRASVTVTLSRAEMGWNQIASPYTYPVLWPKTGTLWKWDAAKRDYVEAAGSVLVPWQGYWFMADSGQAVTLSPAPVFTSGSLAKRAKTYYVTRDEWRIQFELKSAVNSDADNIIGFMPSANQGLDMLDRPEPPRMWGEPYVFVSHPEWNRGGEFASDIRQTFDPKENLFELGIVPGDREAGEVFVVARGVKELADVYAFVGNHEGVGPLASDSAMAVPHSDGVQYKTVWVTADKDFLSKFPHRFAMRAPYPNPFGARVNLAYTLPYRWETNGKRIDKPYEVRIVVYNAQGRAVRNVLDRKQGPGHYQVMWDGRTKGQRPVASGAYLCVLQAEKLRGVKRMVLLR